MTDHADYNDLILGEDPAGQTDSLMSYLAQTATHWDVCDLRWMRGTDAEMELIESSLARAGLYHLILPEKAPTHLCPLKLVRPKR